MRLDGRGVGIELKIDFGYCILTGLADDWRDCRIWETVHDFVDGGSHVGCLPACWPLISYTKSSQN